MFYTKRVPQVLIQNEDLSEEFYQILEDENLDEAQQEKLEKKFSTEMEVIKRDDRLETISKDIVYHFPRRGYLGKGIVVSLDKFTAVKMYDKVSRLWHEQILRKIVDYMRSVEMAVVVSEDAGEEEKFKKQKLVSSSNSRRRLMSEACMRFGSIPSIAAWRPVANCLIKYILQLRTEVDV